MKTIFVLGGYGGTGRVVCRKLLQHTEVSVVVAGRDLQKAEQVVQDLKKDFVSDRVRAIQADASQHHELVEKLRGSSMLLVASNTPQFAKQMVQVALEAGVDYLDYHFNNDVPGELQVLHGEAVKKGRVVITQAGFHPGLPATFVRFGAKYFDNYQSALVGMIMNAPIENPDSILELVDELRHPSGELFENGKWRKAKLWDTKIFDLGRFGKKQCVPLKMLEMRVLPELFPLQNTGTYIAGFNWCTDYFIFPFAFVIGKIFPKLSRRPLAKLLMWGINTFPSSIPGVVFVLQAEGEVGKKKKSLQVVADCQDAYDFTAFCVVACVRQYLDGNIISAGVHMMGVVVDPEQIVTDLKDMSVKIFIKEE